jgi:hypothetical protein
MDTDTQYRLTIYAAGPIEALAESLAALAGGSTVSETTGWWDPGTGIPLKEPAAKIETILELKSVIPALGRIEMWLDGSDQTAVLVEVTPTFARPLYRIRH